jgi:hypothetical protein
MLTTKTLTTLGLLLTLSCAGAPKSPTSREISPGPRALAENALGVCSAAPKPARLARVVDEGCTEATAPAGLEAKLFHQLRYHQSFPASRAEVLTRLAGAAELDAAESAWIAERLPALRFRAGADVMLALFPDAPTAALARLATPTTVAQR